MPISRPVVALLLGCLTASVSAANLFSPRSSVTTNLYPVVQNRQLLSFGIVMLFHLAVTSILLAAPQQAVKIFPVAKVQVGMEGQGQTVLSGSTLTPFGFTVLGVLPDFIGPGQDLILVRLKGKQLEYTGVISGMSGSPVYINKQLLGAVSYRIGSFSKEPIAGVTPAMDMFAAAGWRKRGASAPRSVAPSVQPSLPAGAQPVPIETPLIVGGAAAGLLSLYQKQFHQMGLVPVRGGGSSKGKTASAKKDFYPGGPMSAVLVSGDLTISALGTVTHVQGKQVLGFGHSFLGRGRVNIPLGASDVLTTLPSLAGSSKMGKVRQLVGTLTQDRSVGVMGTVGPLPPMVDVQVELQGPGDLLARDPQRKYSFRVFEDPALTPLLCEVAVSSAIGDRIGFDSGGSVELDIRIDLPGQQTLVFQDLVSVTAGSSVAGSAARILGEALSDIWRNPFTPVTGVQIKVLARISKQHRRAKVVAARISPPTAVPGQKVQISVDLRNYRNEMSTVVQKLVLPKDLERGSLDIHIGSARSLSGLDGRTGRWLKAESYQDVIDNVRQRRRSDRLYIVMVRPQSGLRISGKPLPELPPSMRAILSRGAGGVARGRLSETVVAEHIFDLGAQITSSVELELDVLPKDSL